jgi:molecular chaperone GrpE
MTSNESDLPEGVADESSSDDDFDSELAEMLEMVDGEMVTGELVDDDSESAAVAVEHDIDSLAAERDEWRSRAQYVQAELENFKKRSARETAAAGESAVTRFIKQLLPVLDAFERAVDAVSGADETVRRGVELAFGEFTSTLARNGVLRIEALGEPFDPDLHEAVAHEETGEHEAPVVVEELRAGYRLNSKVIRATMVRVAQ